MECRPVWCFGPFPLLPVARWTIAVQPEGCWRLLPSSGPRPRGLLLLRQSGQERRIAARGGGRLMPFTAKQIVQAAASGMHSAIPPMRRGWTVDSIVEDRERRLCRRPVP